MDIQEYLIKKKDTQELLLNYIDNGDSIQDDSKLFNFLKSQKDPYDLKSLLHFIASISNNHFRSPKFFHKIEQILVILKDQIKLTFSNFEIFNIFIKNKRVLLFLFQEQIVIPDRFIANVITQKKYVNKFCDSYFYPEIRTFIDNEFIGIEYKTEQNPDKFEQERRTGENESRICQLIRNDSINEFSKLIEKEKVPLSKKISPSIFETNSYLLRSHPTLIKYAAFYGSVKIFKYLHSNGIKLNPSLWIYAIHGRNFEIIHFLIDEKIQPKDKTYKECFKESIRFHHNEIAAYIQQNFLDKKKIDDFDVFKHCMKYYNYFYFPKKIERNIVNLFNLCKFDYISLVDLFLKDSDLDINSTIISITLFFFKSNSNFSFI